MNLIVSNKFLLIIIFLLLIILILLYFYYTYNKYNNIEKEKERIVKILIRQGSRWAVAAEQDKYPLIATLHANYATGYLWALKDILSQNDIEKYGNIDLMKYENEILKIQDKITIKNSLLCKDYAPKISYLTKLSGEI